MVALFWCIEINKFQYIYIFNYLFICRKRPKFRGNRAELATGLITATLTHHSGEPKTLISHISKRAKQVQKGYEFLAVSLGVSCSCVGVRNVIGSNG